jgi:diketogulonate reductase-like aldo/keto reductase
MSLKVNRRVPYVPLGKSGLKVSRIILGCLSYGSPEWRKWVLGEEEGIEQIKFAYENGIQTFDTANVSYEPQNKFLTPCKVDEMVVILQRRLGDRTWKSYQAIKSASGGDRSHDQDSPRCFPFAWGRNLG